MAGPTEPTRPIGQPSQPRVTHEREVVAGPDESLLEEVRRNRFWAYFGSAVAVLGSVLALIALLVAMNNDDQSKNTTSAQVEALSRDVANLRSEVSKANSNAQDAADQTDSLSGQVKKLQQSAEDNSGVADDLSKLEQDVNDLSDRVDQIERAQEEAASGGP
jgi:septal ring factor EnvC (AmiA/AmiB activator)